MPGLLTLHTDLKSLKYGHDRPGGGSSSEPYYTVDVNNVDSSGSNPRLGKFNNFRLSSFDGGFIRGGIIGATNASLVDTYRITRFLYSSVKGPLFIAKQVGLQLSNPKLESKQILNTSRTGTIGKVINLVSRILNEVGPTRTYNLGLNTLAQVPVNAFGIHFNRHGLLPVQNENTKYESVVYSNNQNKANRLELLADDFNLGGVAIGKNREFKATRKFNNFTKSALALASNKGLTAGELVIDAYIGGPDSTYGLVSTLIKRYTFTRTEEQGKADKQNPLGVRGGQTRDDKGVPAELSVKSEFLGASNRPTSVFITNNFGKINNRTTLNDEIADKYDYTNPYKTSVSQSNIDTFLGASNRISSSLKNYRNPVLDIFDYPSPKSPTTLIDQKPYWSDIDIFERHLISGSNYNDTAYFGPSSRYPDPNNIHGGPNGDIGPNLLSLPNYTPPNAGNLTASYQNISNSTNALTAPNNLGIYAQLIHTQTQKGYKAINGKRLPSSPYKPIYKSNNSGQTRTITIPHSWRDVTREVRVGSGIYDQINLTPIFEDQAGSVKDKKTDVAGLKINNNSQIQTINDLVKFRIQAIDTDTPSLANWMIFRAYLTQLADSVDATWNPVKYAGRGDKFYIYDGFERKISIGFKVAALSVEEMRPMYQKLNYLMSNLMPDYGEGIVMRGPLVRMTVGNWIDGQLGILTSLSYTVPQESPWEISLDGKEMILPHILEVSLNFTPIGSQTRDVNELARKEECVSNIAQNWNGATPGEPEYIDPKACSPGQNTQTTTSTTTITTTQPNTGGGNGGGGGGISTGSAATGGGGGNNDSNFGGFGGGSFGGGGSASDW